MLLIDYLYIPQKIMLKTKKTFEFILFNPVKNKTSTFKKKKTTTKKWAWRKKIDDNIMI